MFSIDRLKSDKYLNVHIGYLLPSLSENKLGKLTDSININSFIEKLCKVNYERIKYLPLVDISIYKTTDLGLGYINYISIRNLKEMMFLNKIEENIAIDLKYQHGNIFGYIDTKNIDINVLLTDELYLIVKEKTKEICYIKIGKPCNPNRLYYEKDLDNKRGTLKQLSFLEGFNAIYFKDSMLSNLTF